MNKAAAIQLAASIGTAAQGIAGTAAQAAAYLGANSDAPRGGLQKFIQKIRECASKEAERGRIERELANIRAKFCNTSGLTSYKKKKYVWKLVYIFMLGYDIEFGHLEMISLISSPKYSEKAVGYMAVSLLMRSGDEMMNIVINSMRNDLQSHSSPAQSLALATIANMGGIDLVRSLFDNVKNILLQSTSDPCVRKKSALCLLRFYQESNGSLSISPAEWVKNFTKLLEDKHLGIVMSCMALLTEFAASSPSEYESLVPYCILILTRLTIHRTCHRCYFYYDTPAPWLQVKLLQFFQLFSLSEDSHQGQLKEVLMKILTKTDVSESVNKANADHAILFEAINLIIVQGSKSDPELRSEAMHLLGRFISVKEPNIRFLGLETMSRLARLEGNENIKEHERVVLASLRDADISLRKRALDLLFVMSDRQNGMGIVEQLMAYLESSDPAIKEEMVLKIAILAEKFTMDLRWYVDMILQMISIAGDYMSEEVWHRIVQIVTNDKDLQPYAAHKLFNTLLSTHVHETAVNIGGYILGEFGYFIAEQEGMGGEDQFGVLHRHFPSCSVATKALLLSTYAKLANLYPNCIRLVLPVFSKYACSGNLELQQRACEYSRLCQIDPEVMEEVLKEMPSYPEDRETGPEARLRESIEAAQKGALGAKLKPDDSTKSNSTSLKRSAEDESIPAPCIESNLLYLDSEDNDSDDHQESKVSKTVPVMPTSDAAEEVARSDPQSNMTSQIDHWFKALTLVPQGILYDDRVLRIGVVHEYRSSQGRLLMYYYNLCSSIFSDFSVTVDQSQFIRFQVESVQSAIEPGQHVRQQIMCEAMQPFTDPFGFSVRYSLGGTRKSLALKLPIAITSFMEPAPLTAEEFDVRWKMLSGESRERSEVFQFPPHVDLAQSDKITHLISSGLKMAVNSSYMSNDGSLTVTAAGAFKTGSVGQSGSKISVGAMLRIETIPLADSIMITARAVHGKVSVAVKDFAKLHLMSIL